MFLWVDAVTQVSRIQAILKVHSGKMNLEHVLRSVAQSLVVILDDLLGIFCIISRVPAREHGIR